MWSRTSTTLFDGADEVLVVADEHDGAGELDERLLEHVDRVDVEVVRGLVEQDQRVGRDEHLREGEAGALAAGEDAHTLLDVVAVEEEGAEQPALLGGGPAAGDGVHLGHDGVRLVELLELVLGVVGHRDVLAELDLAGVGLELAVDELHERGLAGAVGADERHVVAAVELEVDALVDVVVAEGLRDPLKADDHVARAGRLGEAEAHVFIALGEDDELALYLLDLLHALLSLGGLGRLVAELVDEDLHVGDLALLRGALGAHLLEVVLALLEVGAVVAGIGGDPAVLDGGDVAHAGVHERAVVADEEHRAVVALQEGLEPLDALEVEVVGRLVEHEQVGVAQQELREADAHLPAAGEVLGGFVEVLYREAETRKNLPSPRLELVAPKPLEAVLGMTVLFKKTFELRSRSGRDEALKIRNLTLPGLDLMRGIHNLSQGGLAAHKLGFLL